MGKHKFKPEDFEKPEVPIRTEKKGRWWKKTLGISAAFALLCGAVYGGYLLFNKKQIKGGDEIPKPPIEVRTDSVPNHEDTTIIVQEPTIKNDTSENIRQGGSMTAENKPPEEDLHVPVLSGSLEQKAKHVIRGDFGNGLDRKNKLGSEYEDVQRKVNEMYRNGDLCM